jgi:SAM-dependent methyltransferase
VLTNLQFYHAQRPTRPRDGPGAVIGSYNQLLPGAPLELSIICTRLERSSNPDGFLARLRSAGEALGVEYELIVSPADPEGFGHELRGGLARARAPFVMTVDADVHGPMTFVSALWARRTDAEVVIGSRYVAGSRAELPAPRRLGSRLLNSVFRRGLSVGVSDGSSAIRLYRTDVVNSLRLRADDYDILQEVLVRAFAAGWRVLEVPIAYEPSADVASKAHASLALAYARTFWRLWKLRNSIQAADYDYRAYDSPIPLQRYWQRRRFRHIVELIEGQGAVLDVGCGSSHIIGALPKGSVALDVLMNKLRFARRFPVPRVRASGFALPFADASFPCVLCSQVIEHVPMVPSMIDELCRVLAPGGRLVLGTPDYDRWEWVWIEKAYGLAAPGGYADEHISHYTRRGLLEEFARRGYAHEATRYILRGELILAFRKPAR